MKSKNKWTLESATQFDITPKELQQLAWILDTRGHFFICGAKKSYEIGGIVITEEVKHVVQLGKILDSKKVWSYYGDEDQRFYVNINQKTVFDIVSSPIFDELHLLRPQAECCRDVFAIKSMDRGNSRMFVDEQKGKLEVLARQCKLSNEHTRDSDLDKWEVKEKNVETLVEFIKRYELSLI